MNGDCGSCRPAGRRATVQVSRLTCGSMRVGGYRSSVRVQSWGVHMTTRIQRHHRAEDRLTQVLDTRSHMATMHMSRVKLPVSDSPGCDFQRHTAERRRLSRCPRLQWAAAPRPSVTRCQYAREGDARSTRSASHARTANVSVGGVCTRAPICETRMPTSRFSGILRSRLSGTGWLRTSRGGM